MRFRERDSYRFYFAAGAAELVGACGLRELVENVFGEEFGCGVHALEFGQLIEIAIVERRQGCLQRLMRAANIDDDSVRIEAVGKKRRIDDEGCSVQRLRRPEHGAAERVSNHDVVTDLDGKQRKLPNRTKSVVQ